MTTLPPFQLPIAEPTPVSRPQVFVMLADPVLEGVYRSRLQSTQYCTVWCEKGDRWKESLLAFSYDVVIVDFSIFPSNPVESLLAIKKLSPDSEIIVLSESDDVRIAIAAFQNGVTDYFLKPTNPETVAWAVEKIIRRKAFYPSNAVLGADLLVFSAAHHISVSESDAKMRSLAVKHLCTVLQAAGGVWVWPTDTNVEILQGSGEGGQSAVEQFREKFPGVLDSSFETGLTSHPEQWVRENFAWIPLRTPWMGGVLLYGTNRAPDAAAQARAEFLVRNVEISLENYRRYAEVKQLTYIDDLTGLYNSRYLEVAVEAAIEDFRRASSKFSVLFIDIDHFKKVNDTNGHLVGSQMLIELAQTLKKTMRKPDQLFRYGGDEFIAIMFGADSKQAIDAAERLRADVEQKKFFMMNKELRITLSIGVATFPDHGKEKKTIIQMADDAMYSGKKNGRNTVFIAGQIPQKKAVA